MVTIRRYVDTDEVGHVDHDVNVDGLYVGQVCHWPTQYDGFAAEAGGSESPYIPTLDAAVMWVLRRATPKVWREERGPVPVVWQSASIYPGKWVVERQGGDAVDAVLAGTFDTLTEAIAAAEATS